MPFKIAVIGCGGISLGSHGPSYQQYAAEHGDVELCACCDTHPERAEQFRAQFGFLRSYTRYQEMLESEQPAAVCLNVPVTHLCEIACQVLKLGFPLLCEKPPGLTTVEIDQLIETARSTGGVHQVAFNRRFAPLATELKRRLAGERILHIEHQLLRVNRTDPDFSTTAIHAIDFVRFLSGSDYQHLAFQYHDFTAGSPPLPVTHAFLSGSLAGGASAAISLFPVSGLNAERTQVHTAHSSYVLKMSFGLDTPGSLQHFENGQLVLELDAAQFCGSTDSFILNGFAAEDAALFEAVRGGHLPQPDFAASRQSVAVMQALRERANHYTHPAPAG